LLSAGKTGAQVCSIAGAMGFQGLCALVGWKYLNLWLGLFEITV